MSVEKVETLIVGGPVQPEALVVLGEFSDPDKAAWIVVADVGLVSAATEIEELPAAVRRGRVYAGFSGWGPGQLEAEIGQNAWLTGPARSEILFGRANEHKWGAALKAIGVDPQMLSSSAGQA